MSVIRWNAFREFDDLLAHAPQRQLAARTANQRFTPLADISETGSGYVIELELPGLAAEDVQVSVHDGVLAVAGERVPAHLRKVAEPAPAANAGDDSADAVENAVDAGSVDTESPQLHRRERHYGSFERRFRLPKDANPEAVTASAKDGVLTLTVGRRAEAARRSIEVQVA